MISRTKTPAHKTTHVQIICLVVSSCCLSLPFDFKTDCAVTNFSVVAGLVGRRPLYFIPLPFFLSQPQFISRPCPLFSRENQGFEWYQLMIIFFYRSCWVLPYFLFTFSKCLFLPFFRPHAFFFSRKSGNNELKKSSKTYPQSKKNYTDNHRARFPQNATLPCINTTWNPDFCEKKYGIGAKQRGITQ